MEKRTGSSSTARRGNDIFERKVRPQVDVEKDARKYVAIDLESEDFEVDRNQRAAADRLMERRPEAQGRMWLRRVGSRFAHHFGGRLQEMAEE
jgi:hypothetical protein